MKGGNKQLKTVCVIHFNWSPSMKKNALLVCCVAIGTAFSVRAETIIALTSGNHLVSFDHATPGTLTSMVQVTGLQPGVRLLGIDFRPATGGLYALGSTSRLYELNATTGA